MMRRALLLVFLLSMPTPESSATQEVGSEPTTCVATSSTEPPAEPELRQATDHQSDRPTEPQKEQSFWERTWDDPISYFTLWLTILSALTFATACAQATFLYRTNKISAAASEAAEHAANAAKASADAATEANNANRRLQRAYVFSTTCSLVGAGALDILQLPKEAIASIDPLVLTLELRNHGQTPAASVLVNVGLSVDGGPDFESSALPVYVTIPPGATGEFVTHFKCKIPYATFQRIGGFRQRVLTIWGNVTYRDAFGDHHQTSFEFDSNGFADAEAPVSGRRTVTFEKSEGDIWT